MKAKVILRWLAIAGFGGYGLYTLVGGILHVWAQPDDHWAFVWFFLLPVMLVSSGVFIALAYFIFRRQYRDLCTLASALAAVIVFSLLSSIPVRLGLPERVPAWSEPPWAFFIVLPLSLAALLIPFYAARWAYRRSQAFLLTVIHDDPQPKRAD